MEVSMKRKGILSLILCALICLLSTTPSHALFDSDVKKAKEFISAGMYPQAISLLEKRINDKPTDVEAHYQLGICYIKIGNFGGADARFGSIVKLDSEYGYKIGNDWKQAGDEAFKSGRDSQASGLFTKAIQYQPNLKDGIIEMAFAQGKVLFDKSQYDAADSKFRVATKFDSSLNQRISTMYFELGNKAVEERCIGYYNRASNFSSNHNKEIGKRLLTIAEKNPLNFKKYNRYRKLASSYVEVPLDYKVYECGEHPMNLKAGEITKYKITYPRGSYPSIISHDDKIKFIYDDGKVLEGWKLKKMPHKSYYRIQAVTDQKMIIKVRCP